MRKNKKGFTIVELVIVIAVIAVLTAVLVPTFIHLSNKAKRASDQSLVNNLNTALAMEKGETGKDPKTMHDAVEGLKNQGYLLPQLVTKSDQELVYSLKDNKFLLSGEAEGDKVNYWHIESSKPATQEWSIYAYNWTGDADGITVDFDAGDETQIAEVGYVGARDGLIRTAAYTTNVKVETDYSVTHYGNTGKVDIIKVAMASFHEHGNARVVNLTQGNLEVEATGNVTLVTSTQTDSTKAKVTNKGVVEVVAAPEAVVVSGISEGYRATAAIDPENTAAIVDGTAKTSLAAADFVGTSAAIKKVILLKDFELIENLELHYVDVIGNMTKLKANVTGSDAADVVTLKNIHTTYITTNNYKGSLPFDGGLIDFDSAAPSNAQNTAIYVNGGYGSFTFKNMTVSARTNKAIKVNHAKKIVVDNCVFDARNMDASQDVPGAYTARSLAAIDIQEQNLKLSTGADAGNGKMSIEIKNSTFNSVPQGAIKAGIADSDTAGAIKIKTEKAPGEGATTIAGRSAGFESVVISGNKFVNNYRDVVVGCNVFQTLTGTKEQADFDAAGNVIEAPVWTISDNTTTLSESVIAGRATLTYQASVEANSIAERVGRLEGGCGVWETARSAKSWLAA